jgi:hypothetical protein
MLTCKGVEDKRTSSPGWAEFADKATIMALTMAAIAILAAGGSSWISCTYNRSLEARIGVAPALAPVAATARIDGSFQCIVEDGAVPYRLKGVEGLMNFFAGAAAAACAFVLSLSAGHAETTTICGQSVEYSMTRAPSDASPELRAFLGIWVGEATFPAGGPAEGTQCRGFVIESVGANGTVVAKQIWGDRVRYSNGVGFAVKPGVRPWRGKTNGTALKFESPSGYGFELRLVTASSLRGVYITPNGNGTIQLSRQ